MDNGTIGYHAVGDANPRELAFPSDVVEGESKEIATKNWVNAQGFGSGGSLTSTYVGYGSGANALTGEAGFEYNATSNLFTVPNITVSGTATLGALDITTLNATALQIGGVPITASAPELNFMVGVTSAVQTQLGTKAALASPTFTGDPLAPTPAGGDNDTSIATTAYVQTAITGLGGGTDTYLAKATTYTAVSGERINADTNAGAWTLTLPATPANGACVWVADARKTWGTNNLTIARNGQSIDGAAADYTANVSGSSIQFVYESTGGWRTYLSGNGIDIQAFTSSGTWTKPANAQIVEILMIGGGGGGGSGRRGAAGTDRFGGGGGGAGQTNIVTVPASSMGSTETITIGAGGAGGAAVTADDSNGNVGTVGGATTVGTLFKGTGGNFGAAGTTALAAGGAGKTTYNNNLQSGGAYASGGASTASTGTAGSAVTHTLPTGGGGGGTASAANLAYGGGAGGEIQTGTAAVIATTQTAATGGTASTNGTAGTTRYGIYGCGGGGGGASITTTAGSGGAAATYGGGGGGGGASLNGNNSGAGGAGAGGYCIITTRCAK